MQKQDRKKSYTENDTIIITNGKKTVEKKNLNARERRIVIF